VLYVLVAWMNVFSTEDAHVFTSPFTALNVPRGINTFGFQNGRICHLRQAGFRHDETQRFVLLVSIVSIVLVSIVTIDTEQ
jgi:hypothetical protein